MFMGEYSHTTDAKGRLFVPAKLREGLGDKFVITKGLDGCLFAYGQEEWERVESELKNLPLTNKVGRQFMRIFFSGATEAEVDRQGRILLPTNLREYAGITKDVISVGVSTKVEIWSRERYEGMESSWEDMDEMMEELSGMGIRL